MAAKKGVTSRAFYYLRLSREDGDKEESNSIANQRQFIMDYVSRQDDIVLVREYCDDGFTGTNFERPQFMMMMTAIERGEADCVIVKDLSRFGRDYIDSGKYIQKIFPMLGVRFIAINDNVDSGRSDRADDLIIPFKNLINDSYCRDLSLKLRGQFRVQRKKGEYIGPYVFFGYVKSEADKHKLEIDPFAADVVREIFQMKLKGNSQQQIADDLNGKGIPAPAEYKKLCGLKYQSGFQQRAESRWTAVAITRILTNRIYTGCLEQGKRGTPNYKVKKMVEKPKDEWVVVEHNHEPIIDDKVFTAVQRILKRDTRISKDGVVRPLSGYLYCGDCKNQMVYRSVKRNGVIHGYYVCGANRTGRGCSSHSFSAEKLEEAVLRAINAWIKLVTDVRKDSQKLGDERLRFYRARRYDDLIEAKRREIDDNKDYRMKLYESFVDEIITREEYVNLRQHYTRKIEECQKELKQLEEELRKINDGLFTSCSWMDHFLRYGQAESLNRELVMLAVDQIFIYEDKRFEIVFNFKDELEEIRKYLDYESKEAG